MNEKIFFKIGQCFLILVKIQVWSHLHVSGTLCDADIYFMRKRAKYFFSFVFGSHLTHLYSSLSPIPHQMYSCCTFILPRYILPHDNNWTKTAPEADPSIFSKHTPSVSTIAVLTTDDIQNSGQTAMLIENFKTMLEENTPSATFFNHQNTSSGPYCDIVT